MSSSSDDDERQKQKQEHASAASPPAGRSAVGGVHEGLGRQDAAHVGGFIPRRR